MTAMPVSLRPVRALRKLAALTGYPAEKH